MHIVVYILIIVVILYALSGLFMRDGFTNLNSSKSNIYKKHEEETKNPAFATNLNSSRSN